MRARVLAGSALFAIALGGCADQKLPRDQLLDPQTCASCHAAYVKDWSGSMHAYAADDPVFRAMNARGQRETGGQLGNFCVNCHAPMAVREGATTDGLNLDSVPQKLRGVTCYFCHTVAAVAGAHDNPLTLASDNVLRASFSDPVSNSAHHAGYSELLDGSRLGSSALCGACHDVTTPAGGNIERTYAEWQASVFNAAPNGRTCGQCHMRSTPRVPIADSKGVFARTAHSHQFPGVDLALTPAPEADPQKQAVQAFLDSSVQSTLCVAIVGGQTKLRVLLDNVGAGHGWPSGAAQDRRAWIEIIAYAGGSPIYKSGVVPDGTSVVSTAASDPDLWLLRDCMADTSGAPVDMFWQAASSAGLSLVAIPPSTIQAHARKDFPADGSAFTGVADRVTLRLRLQPVGLDVLDDLIGSGDLDAAVRAQMTTFDVGTTPPLEWTATAPVAGTILDDGVAYSCVSAYSFNVSAPSTPTPSHATCGK
jgi:hypothetical protein